MGRRTNIKALGIKIAQRQKSKDRVTQRDYKEGEKEAVKAAGGYSMGGPSFNYDEKHPKVQSLKKFINKNREEKSKTIGAKIFGKKKPMTDKEAKKLADKIESRTSKRVTASDGSFSKGGMCRGMGAAIRGGKFEGVK